MVSSPNRTILSVYPWPAFMLDPIIKSMWAPWPGYALPSSMWRLLQEADNPSNVVHQSQPHEVPIVDGRGHWPRLKTPDDAATVSADPGTTQRCTMQPSPAAAGVQAALGAAVAAGARSFTVPFAADPYCFGRSSLLIERAPEGLEVNLGNNTFVFSMPHGILIRDSVGVTLRGAGADSPAQISYDPPTTAQGVIASTNHSKRGTTTARVTLESRFPGADALNPGALCQLWRGSAMFPHFGDCKQVKCVDGGPPGICISTPGTYAQGAPIAFPLYRSGYTISVVNGSACRVRDVHILSASFMAVTELVGVGGNSFERVRVGWTPQQAYTPFLQRGGFLVPQPLISSNADVFHSYGTRRGPRLSNCTFEYAADDFFNVHNEMQVAFQMNVTDRSTLYLIDPHLPVDQVGKKIGARIPRTVYGSVNSLDYARAGDSLSFAFSQTPCKGHVGSCQWSNFTAVGSSAITSIRRVTEPAVLVAAAATLKRFCDGVPCQNSPADFVYHVLLSEAITIPDGGCLANVDGMSAAGSIIEDCIFQHSNANLGRTKSGHSSIIRNTFRNAAECVMEAVPLQQYLEGPWAIPNVTIAGNTFEDCPASCIKRGALANVIAFNNTFQGNRRLKTTDVTAQDAWRLTFSDDFDGESLNSSRWSVADGGTHGANELELYLAEDVWVRDGYLTIQTRYHPTTCLPSAGGGQPSDGHGWCTPTNDSSSDKLQHFNFSSGWVDTESHFQQQFGRFAVRAKLPSIHADNVWPAHWLLPDTTSPGCKARPESCYWPIGGEIDIMESYGNKQQSLEYNTDGNVFGTYHWANQSGHDLHCGGATPSHRCAPYNFSGAFPGRGTQADFSTGFHVYSVDWNASSIAWFVDGIQYWERHNGDRPGTDHSAQICAHEMYLILNTAISKEPTLPSDRSPPHYPVQHVIDWVKVWERVPGTDDKALKSDDVASTYLNPVITVNSPDPGVLGLADGRFVAVTSSGFDISQNVFPIRTSTNLVDWTLSGAIFPRAPAWASPPFYAPEIHGPVVGTGKAQFWAVYDATDNESGTMMVGAAWADQPTGPFKDLGMPLQRVFEPGAPSHPKPHAGAIDATLWQNQTDETIHLLWKNKLSTGVRQIAAQKLKVVSGVVPSLRADTAHPPKILLLATEAWEAHDVEGPFLWQEPGLAYLYLFYSGSNTWGSSYAIGVARSKSIDGPWEKKGAPVAHTRSSAAYVNSTWVSPGHNSVVRKGGATYLVYHANKWGQTGVNCVRRMMVDRLVFGSDDWPRLATKDGAPSDTPVPMPSVKSDDSSMIPPSHRPNLIFTLVDDWGYNDVGFHNSRNEHIIRTPNMDRLSSSEHGIRLEKAYSQPICTPTRSQTLTGRYQIHTGLQHGVLWMGQENGIPLNETTAAEYLSRENYTTHAIGKWHVGFANLSMTPLRRGFDTFLGFWGGSENHWTHHSGHLDFRSGEAVARNYSSNDESNASYSTHIFSRRAVEIIQEHAHSESPPFFIYLAYQATHAPLQAPPEVVESFSHVKDPSRRTLAAMAAVVDEGVGNITDALMSTGNNNTVFFISGDNGGQVRAGGNNWPMRGFKGSLWEGGCRASAFVWSPLLPPRKNFVWRGLVHVSDWLPTALELAGVAKPSSLAPALDGFSMWGAWVAGTDDSPRTELLHEIDRIAFPRFQCSGPIAPVDGNGTGGWSLPAVQDRYVRAAIHAVINGTSWKLVIGECAGWDTDSRHIPPPNWPAPLPLPLPSRCKPAPNSSTFQPPINEGTWLFNLDEDESERCDLSAAEPALLAEMVRRLDKYRATEVPVRYPDGNPKLDPSRCEPPLDYWFASDEPGMKQQCQGKHQPPSPPPSPPSPAPGPAGVPVRFEVAGNASACLVAPGSGGGSAWLVVGSCLGNNSMWRHVGHPQLESVAFPGLCVNVFGGPPSCCPGGAHSTQTKFHLTKCGWGPGNVFAYDGHGHIKLEGVAKWNACAGLCAVPTSPLVTLQNCSADQRSMQWKRVPVVAPSASTVHKTDDATSLLLLPPQPLSPRRGMNLTDVALHFQFSNCTVAPSPPLGCKAGSSYAFTTFFDLHFSNFLTPSQSANSAEQCAEQCCRDNECAVWNYKDVLGCRTGSQYDLLKIRAYPAHTLNSSGWLGATRLAPHSWKARHCATYEVQLSRSPDFTPPLISLPTIAYCCPDGGQSCAEAHTLRRCSHECDPKSSAGKCDVDTTSHAMWHARPGIQSFWPTLFANASGLWPTGNNDDEHPKSVSLPSPGQWHWRIRGFAASDDTATAWSAPSSFVLNNDRAPRPPVRTLSPTEPLLHLEGWVVEPDDFPSFRAAIPSDLLPFSALVFDTRFATQKANLWVASQAEYPWGGKAEYQLLGDYLEPTSTAGLDILISTESGPHWAVDYQSLAEIERLFQISERFVGTRLGEAFWNWHWYQPGVQALKQSFVRALITLCGKYGRRFVWGDGNHEGWRWNQLLNDPLWQPFLQQYASAIVLLPKTNIIPHWFSAQSALQGGWLMNFTAATGVWCECWYWNSAGFGSMGEPPTFNDSASCMNFPNSMWAQSFLLGAAQGGTVFAVEGEGCTTKQGDASGLQPNPGQPAIWNHTGSVLPAWTDFLVPFFRALVSEKLIPTKAEIIQATKVWIIDDLTNLSNSRASDASCHNASCFSEGPFQPLFNATYGYRGSIKSLPSDTGIRTQLIPTSGRYHFIPLLPNGSIGPAAADGEAITTLQLSDPRMRDEKTVQALYEPLYPAADRGTAWVEQIGGRFFVMPAAEWDIVQQTFRLPLAGKIVTGLAGAIGVSELRMGRFELKASERLFVFSQSNWNHTTTVLNVSCTKRPLSVVIRPPSAQVAPPLWAAGVLTVSATHTHVASVFFTMQFSD